MSFKCHDCREVFEECEIFTEKHGLDTPPYEEINVCPYCGSSEIEETVVCKKCRAEVFEEETVEGLCTDCVSEIVEKYKNDVQGCYNLCKEDDDKIEINWFLSRMFSPSQINEILLRELLTAQKTTKIDCLPYINYDLSAFIETVLWEEKHEHKKEK